MHLVVNALSIGSMSGQHVVYGFMRPMVEALIPAHQITVVHYAGEAPPQDLQAAGLRTVEVDSKYRKWYRRLVWESFQFEKLARSIGADKVLSVSGAMTPRCRLPQVVLCQNPWCYVSSAQYGMSQRFKATLQRIGYSRAFRSAERMIYISNHLRSLYQKANNGRSESAWDIAYVGLNQDTYDCAVRLESISRRPLSIVSVSAMAPWKGALTLVEAVGILGSSGIDATLDLVGPWPVPSHNKEVERKIEQLGLTKRISIRGKVSDDQLHELYATSQVFCLMSGCESFGIPAAEAMAFGTPVVSTDCCAIAEVCEGAGMFGPVGDPVWTANSLQMLLTDETRWKKFSEEARERARRLNWRTCSRALIQAVDPSA